MKSYHNNPALKTMMVEEAAAHRAKDQLVKGVYGQTDRRGNFRGCAVGCTIDSLNVKLGKQIEPEDHAAYETELGIPTVLARLEDRIFEGLPAAQALLWPQRFLEAIPVGVELAGVADKFLHWLLVDPTDGVIRFAKNKEAVQNVGNLYAKKIAGKTVTKAQWCAAEGAAYAYADADADAAAPAAPAAYAYAAAAAGAAAGAAARAARAARAAYAADAADAAAYAAAEGAAYAAAAAYAPAAPAAAYAYVAAAREKAYVRQSETLLNLLSLAAA